MHYVNYFNLINTRLFLFNIEIQDNLQTGFSHDIKNIQTIKHSITLLKFLLNCIYLFVLHMQTFVLFQFNY